MWSPRPTTIIFCATSSRRRALECLDALSRTAQIQFRTLKRINQSLTNSTPLDDASISDSDPRNSLPSSRYKLMVKVPKSFKRESKRRAKASCKVDAVRLLHRLNIKVKSLGGGLARQQPSLPFICRCPVHFPSRGFAVNSGNLLWTLPNTNIAVIPLQP